MTMPTLRSLLLGALVLHSLTACANARRPLTVSYESPMGHHIGEHYFPSRYSPRLLPPAERRFAPPVPDTELQRHLRARRPGPARLRFGWIDYWDYPNPAIRAEEQGVATIRLLVSPAGRVESCELVATSGFRAIDAASCAVPLRRFHYLPALGRGGRPVRAAVTHRVAWRLPEAWPTLIEQAPLPNFLLGEAPPPP